MTVEPDNGGESPPAQGADLDQTTGASRISKAREVVTLDFGFSEQSEGFACMTKDPPWDPQRLGEARRLAELDLEQVGGARILSAYRFWGEFRGHAVGLAFSPARGRAGSFQVTLHGVLTPEPCAPPDPNALSRGSYADLKRAPHLKEVAQLEKVLRSKWLVEAIAMGAGLSGGCAIAEWDDVDHAARLLSVLPWAIGRKIQIVSTPAATSYVDGAPYFDMSKAPEERGDLPSWVTEFLNVLERALGQVDDFAAFLAWLDEQPPFEDLEGLFLALKISFDPEPNVPRGVERVGRWIGQHSVPAEVRVALGMECIQAFLVTGANDCVPYLETCAEQWRAADDGQDVAWKLLDYLGAKLAESRLTRPGIDLLRVLAKLSSGSSAVGGAGLVHAISRAFANGAACHEGTLDAWIENLTKVDLGEHLQAVTEPLIERFWSEMDGVGYGERRQLMHLRRQLGDLGRRDLLAALQVSEEVSRYAYGALPRAQRPPLHVLLGLATHKRVDAAERPVTIRHALAIMGSALKRPGTLEGVCQQFPGDDEVSRQVYSALWKHLSNTGYRATGLELREELMHRPELRPVAKWLHSRMPVNWHVNRARRWWLVTGALLVFAAPAYLWLVPEHREAVTSWLEGVMATLMGVGDNVAPPSPVDPQPGSPSPAGEPASAQPPSVGTSPESKPGSGG